MFRTVGLNSQSQISENTGIITFKIMTERFTLPQTQGIGKNKRVFERPTTDQNTVATRFS